MENRFKFLGGLAILTGIAVIYAGTGHMIGKETKRQIVSFINEAEFPEGTFLEGTKIKYSKIKCNYFSCDLDDFTLYVPSSDLAYGDLRIELDSFPVKDHHNASLYFKNIELSENIKNHMFYSYDEEGYRDVGNKLYTSLFPFDMNLSFDIKKKDEKADGWYSLSVSNSFADAKFKSFIDFTEGPLDEVIPFEKIVRPSGEEDVAEIKLTDLPYKIVTKKLNAEYKDKNTQEFLYGVYRLLAMNESKDGLLGAMNEFYLDKYEERIFDKDEFLERFKNLVSGFISEIPEDELAFTEIMNGVNKILKKESNRIGFAFKNREGVSNTAIEVLVSVSEDTTIPYLDDVFDIKVKTHKEF